jgi:hypothetical protein
MRLRPAKLATGARASRLSRRCLVVVGGGAARGLRTAGRVFHLGADGDWELCKAALAGPRESSRRAQDSFELLEFQAQLSGAVAR